MSCLEADLEPPEIPDIFVTPPLIPNLPLPIGVGFCCYFSINDILGAQATIAATNAELGALGGEVNCALGMARAEILAAAGPLLRYALVAKLDCPLE